MDHFHWLSWLLLLLCAGASSLFSVAETALFSLGRWQLKQLAEEHPQRGALVAQLLSRPQDLLATMVLGNTLCFAAMLAIVTVMTLAGHWSMVPSFAAVLVLLVFGCELLPKTLAVRRPEQWSLRVVALLRHAHQLLFPLRRVSQALIATLLRATGFRNVERPQQLTEFEYRELIELAQQQGALQRSEKEIILQITWLDQRTVSDVMKPRAQMACISDDLTVEEMLAAARRHGHRRLPLYDESPDTIVGVLDTWALLLDPTVDLADAIEFPSFVPETMNLLLLLRSFQRQHRSLAIALDEFGGTAGLVTVEDILEELVGEEQGRTEAEALAMKRLEPGRWSLHGGVRVDDFRREYPALGDVEDVETMGGLLLQLLEVVPAAGESAVFRGLRLTATASDGRRIRELLVERVK